MEHQNYQYPSRYMRGRPEKNFLSFWDDYINFPEKYIDSKYFTFNVDIQEHDDQYIIEAEMAGLNKEDISIEAEYGQIILSANRKTVQNEDNYYLKNERNFGHFQRIFYLKDLDEKNITAEYKDGLLTIKAKKSTKKSDTTNKISIK
jgi:HSP20 family protein